jgi:hypothetical protein
MTACRWEENQYSNSRVYKELLKIENVLNNINIMNEPLSQTLGESSDIAVGVVLIQNSVRIILK